eukprot:Nk52_evm1s234 gene=Nk52_evmTU1s234
MKRAHGMEGQFVAHCVALFAATAIVPVLLALIPGAYGAPLQLPFCFFGRFNSGGWERIMAWEAAMEEFSQQPNVEVLWKPNTTYVMDDKAQPALGLDHSFTSLNTLNCVGLHGSMNSDVCTAVGNYLSFKGIPQLSGSCSSPTLSLKSTYPSFVRALGSSALEVSSMLRFFQENNWKKIGVVYQDGALGLGILTDAQSFAPSFDIKIDLIVGIPVNFAALKIDITSKMNLISGSDVRVFLLGVPLNDFVGLYPLLDAMGIAGNEQYVIAGDFSWATAASDVKMQAAFGNRLNDVLRGLFFANPSVATGTPAYDLFASRYRAISGLKASDSLAGTWAYFWDTAQWACLALNNAVKALTDAGLNPKCLMEGTYNSNPTGCSISDTLRDSLFATANCTAADSTASCVKREGVVKTMEYRKAQSSDAYGALSKKASIVFLNALYATKFTGATGPFALNENGDRDALIGILNAQTVSGSTEWKQIGIVHDNTWVPNVQDSAIYMGGTESAPSTTPPSDGSAAPSSSSGLSLGVILGAAGGAFILVILIAIIVYGRIASANRRAMISQMKWLLKAEDLVFRENNKAQERSAASEPSVLHR